MTGPMNGSTNGTTPLHGVAPLPTRPWEDLSLAEQQDCILQSFSPVEWLTDAAVLVGAVVRQQGDRTWYHWKAQAKERGVDGYGYEKAVDQLLRDLDLPRAVPGAAPGTSATLGATCWSKGVTAADFLAQVDAEVAADARDLVVPGCITLLAAPRASGKSIVALYLALALAQGGVFRGERVPQRRVALIDRDNPPALVRKRLGWLGAQQVTTLTVFTRDTAPPLTDAEAWAAFPVDHFDVIVVDSIGAATEGVSEKEGKQTQQYLATLKDVARRGPAILALDNTNKAAQNYRGRGEKGDAVDIVYECRNITGWTPTQGGDWWEDLPDCGEHTWQQRASRRKGQPVLHIAFVPSKFRLGIEPEPFVLAIDTTQEPWTLDDITEDIATAGHRAAEETQRLARAKLEAAEAALVQALRTRAPEQPMLKREAEDFLCAHGLRQKVARTLLMQGGNRDGTPAGQWVLRAIRGARGNPTGVFLPGEEEHNQNNIPAKSPMPDATSPLLISVDGSTPSDQKTAFSNSNIYADEIAVGFRLPRGCKTTEIDTRFDKKNSGSQKGGIISVTDIPSSDPVRDAPCLHEHVNDANACNDCGESLSEGTV